MCVRYRDDLTAKQKPLGVCVTHRSTDERLASR